MAISSTLVIDGSVGRGGRNKREDVRAVQTRLNELMSTPRMPLTVDGLNGPKTTGAIRDFQRSVVGMSWPDGRVDVGKRTHQNLNDPLSADIWKGSNMTAVRAECPAVGAPDPAAGPAAVGPSAPQSQSESRARKYLDEAADELRWSSAEYDAFARDVLDNPNRSIGMGMLSVITTTETAKDFLHGWRVMRSGGCSNRDLVRALADSRNSEANFKAITQAGKKPGFVRYLSGFATAADRLALVMVAMEVHDHVAHDRWGAAASIIYQLWIGKRFPWASMVNAIQGIVTVFFPGAADSRFFRAVRTLDPVGVGGVGVDSFITASLVAIEALHKGQLNMGELIALRDRMADSPVAVVAELGDGLGDAVYDLRHTVSLRRDAGVVVQQIGRDLASVPGRFTGLFSD